MLKVDPVVPKPKTFGGGIGGKKKGGLGGLKKGGLGGSLKKGLGSMGFTAEEDDKPKLSAPPSAMFSPPASPEASSPVGLSDYESDVDPLDAFMNGIESEVKDTTVTTSWNSKPSNDPAKLKTISWDEIQNMGNQGEEDKKGEGEEDDYTRAFLNAIKEEQAEEERLVAEEKAKLAAAEEAARKKAKEKDTSGRFEEDLEEEYWVDVEEEEAKYLEMLKKRKLAKV